jgi:D-threo-aldose 1-dehydrogenase
VSVVAGAISPAEVEGNIAAIGRSIPSVLWSDLKAERLIRGDAPVPM